MEYMDPLGARQVMASHNQALEKRNGVCTGRLAAVHCKKVDSYYVSPVMVAQCDMLFAHRHPGPLTFIGLPTGTVTLPEHKNILLGNWPDSEQLVLFSQHANSTESWQAWVFETDDDVIFEVEVDQWTQREDTAKHWITGCLPFIRLRKGLNFVHVPKESRPRVDNLIRDVELIRVEAGLHNDNWDVARKWVPLGITDELSKQSTPARVLNFYGVHYPLEDGQSWHLRAKRINGDVSGWTYRAENVPIYGDDREGGDHAE